jgi:hypothetical protein
VIYFKSNLSSEPVEQQPNVLLTQMVDDVLMMCSEVEPTPDSLQLPLSKLKLSIVGKPFSGKKSLAKLIAETFNLQVLNVTDICKSALE